MNASGIFTEGLYRRFASLCLRGWDHKPRRAYRKRSATGRRWRCKTGAAKLALQTGAAREDRTLDLSRTKGVAFLNLLAKSVWIVCVLRRLSSIGSRVSWAAQKPQSARASVTLWCGRAGRF